MDDRHRQSSLVADVHCNSSFNYGAYLAAGGKCGGALTNAFCLCPLQQAENEIWRLPAVTSVNARVMRDVKHGGGEVRVLPLRMCRGVGGEGGGVSFSRGVDYKYCGAAATPRGQSLHAHPATGARVPPPMHPPRPRPHAG
jgi:hypothetical protein